MRRRLLAVWVALLAGVTGCSTTHAKAAPSTTTTTTNPYAVPPVITAAYVDTIFVALNHIQGDATRAMIATDSLSVGALTDLRATFDDPLYAKEVAIYEETLRGGFPAFRRPLGDITTTVVALISASSKCMFVRTISRNDAVLLHPTPPPAAEYWALRPKQPDIDPEDYNPTPWALAYNADFPSNPPAHLSNPCGL